MVGGAALLRRRGRAAARPCLEMRLHLLLKCSKPIPSFAPLILCVFALNVFPFFAYLAYFAVINVS
jgi:hypothetical protein